MSNRLYSNRVRLKKNSSKRTRPKAFKSEESAKKWAESQGLKNYSLRNLKGPESKRKKIKIVLNS